MANSEQHLRMLAQGAGDWGGSIRAFIGWYGKNAADVLAGAEGVERRTAERWIAKATDKINPRTGRPSQASTPKPMQQVGIVELAKRHRAARKLRATTRIRAGKVWVTYEGEADPNRRGIKDQDVTGDLESAVLRAANLVEEGDYAGAAEEIDRGLLESYGVPEDTLEISDYVQGLEFVVGPSDLD